MLQEEMIRFHVELQNHSEITETALDGLSLATGHIVGGRLRLHLPRQKEPDEGVWVAQSPLTL